MASPLSFEDPKDCKNRVRYDLLTTNQILRKYYQESYSRRSDLPQEYHMRFAEEWLRKTKIRDTAWVINEQEKDFEEFAKRMGVLSLTSNPLSKEMWDKYGDAHRGFCVGFDPKVMFRFLGGGGAVTYEVELPIIMPRPIDSFDVQHIKQVFVKEKKWEFEEEYRTTKFEEHPHTEETRKVILPLEAYIEVILGLNCPNEHRNEIIEIVIRNMPHVKIFKIIKDGNNNLIKTSI